jgi:anti-sigma B factor antagonist
MHAWQRWGTTAMTHRHFVVNVIGDVTVVHFTDARMLDEETVQSVAEELFSLVDENYKKLLLNFSNVEYMSSAALGQLINLHKRLVADHGRLVLCGMSPQIYEIFEITKLDRIFKIRRGDGPVDPGAEFGSTGSRLIPPKPSRDQSAALRPPPDGL